MLIIEKTHSRNRLIDDRGVFACTTKRLREDVNTEEGKAEWLLTAAKKQDLTN